ncbi:hypothetical protein BDF20DRAFT_865410 [Mycotypha africana]|uniref:uncharacterized protein n=1 Tax=Mycotypha africana TaxID=64632 RepID=UPI00230081A5|nr:uncharacterized protein BDF20DRAFT_865410 [Mycotypha africana]KAI8982184.1 hypothetical protein BDF20DRAFT_865410 [Mycotypha africana]
MANYYHTQQPQSPLYTSYYQDPLTGNDNQYHASYHQPNYNNNNAFAMHDLPTANYYPEYNAKHYHSNLSTTGHDDYHPQPTHTLPIEGPIAPDPYHNEKRYSRVDRQPRHTCCDTICCGCCTCCPKWCRWFTCILFLIIVALGIVVGVLAALFKQPSVEFTGIKGEPTFGLVGNNVNLNLSLGFSVNNPNIESVTFKSLSAKAYYHGDSTELGGGTLNDLHIGSNAVTNISFPFNMSMDIMASGTQAVVYKLLSDCGILGGSPKDISIDYKVIATVSIIGISINVPYSNSVNGIQCPIEANQLDLLNKVASLLNGLTNGGGSDVSNTINSIAQSLPTQFSALIPTEAADILKNFD